MLVCSRTAYLGQTTFAWPIERLNANFSRPEARQGGMAEREGFEPPIGLHLCRISSAVHSTTLPPLQAPCG